MANIDAVFDYMFTEKLIQKVATFKVCQCVCLLYVV